jgi:pSer/pThr/pTyr-binding forkhead associated (FHA) protein
VKSSNGTYINGERLSPEGYQSEPCELKSEDIIVSSHITFHQFCDNLIQYPQEFGVDILEEDKETIVHPKIAARVNVGA